MPTSRTSGRRRRPATLQTVADAVGVSVQTVANTLRHPERVSEGTRLRVIEEVRRQRYQPNTAGRSLRTNRVDLLGVCVSRPLSDGGVDTLLRAATLTAQERGFHVLAFTEHIGSVGAAYEELLRTHAVDGFVLTGTEVDDPRHVWLHDRGVPFVAIGRRWTTELGAFVDFDGIAAMQQLVGHLLAAGRRRIAWVGPDVATGPEAERLVGVEQALADSPAELVATCTMAERNDDPGVVDRVFSDLDAAGPDAVIAATERIAVSVWAGLGDAGVDLGADGAVAVCGYGRGELARQIHLTTVAEPISIAADEAVRMLIELIDEPDRSLEPRFLATEVVPGRTG